jgi:hypothetical protein
MATVDKVERGFTITAREVEGASNALKLSFTPRGLQQERESVGAPRIAPEFQVIARLNQAKVSVEWLNNPPTKSSIREMLEQEAETRLRERANWIDGVSSLVDMIEGFVRQWDWSTRRVDKLIRDSRVGDHRLPALLMQKGTTRLFLEPVGRSAPGSQGVVDLYLMPSYDDIASLYLRDGAWHLQYVFPETKPVSMNGAGSGAPLSRASLRRVLDAMRQSGE